MGMNDIKASPGGPPGGGSKPQLIDPTRLSQRHRDSVIAHARKMVLNNLRKYMNIVPGGQLLDQRDGITLGPTAGR